MLSGAKQGGPKEILHSKDVFKLQQKDAEVESALGPLPLPPLLPVLRPLLPVLTLQLPTPSPGKHFSITRKYVPKLL